MATVVVSMYAAVLEFVVVVVACEGVQAVVAVSDLKVAFGHGFGV